MFYEIRKRWFDGQKIKVRQKVGLEYCKTILWVSLFKLENGNSTFKIIKDELIIVKYNDPTCHL